MNSIIPSIMQSIKPQYCELIAAGKKRFEVRKTKPKLKPPFKVYIYCTLQRKYFSIGYRMRAACDNLYMLENGTVKFGDGFEDYGQPASKLNGKVIGEYICDEIQEWVFDNETNSYDISDDDLALTCLTQEHLREYGKGKTLYGYHISNLKIYDEPKELSDFVLAKHCFNFKNVDIVQNSFGDYVAKYSENSFCRQCPHLEDGWCEKIDGQRRLTRPPQSWCYCEEV